MVELTHCAPPPPATHAPHAEAAPDVPPLGAAPAATVARLNHLFRRSLLKGQVHPLQIAVYQHRGVKA